MTAELDTVTKRPRTPNDPYTHLTDEQARNIKKDASPFFHTKSADGGASSGPIYEPKEGGRYNRDRYTNVTSQHLVRGISGSQPFGWIDFQWSRFPPEEYNTCRGRAAVRWGPNKAGERTRSHFFGESIDRYTTVDMYRRNPTNYPGRVVMDCGRPADGYYAQKYPTRTTWFGSSVPLNRQQVMEGVYQKTMAEYEDIRKAEQLARESRRDQWPEFSEYTDRYLLATRTEPVLSDLEEKKRNIETAKLSA